MTLHIDWDGLVWSAVIVVFGCLIIPLMVVWCWGRLMPWLRRVDRVVGVATYLMLAVVGLALAVRWCIR